MDEKITVPKRILSSLISSVSAGVVPRMGAPYIAIGRDAEIAALLSDLESVKEGGSAMRFLIGKYGSGKSFLMQLMRGYALERGFLCADADLSPERRICGGKGSGIATYRELIRNLASRTSPEGGALPQLLAKWLSALQGEVAASGLLPEDPSFRTEVSKKVFALTRELENNVGGFDYAAVISEYYRASVSDDEAKKSCCLRWLRGEYTTKTEARADLSVGSIIDDESWYDYIKLWAEFARKIGYHGLVVFLDECVNLYKIVNRVSRENNYEKLLSMFNDTLQGRAPGLSMILGGTPQFLEDTRRGLFSYEALRSRLADSRFGNGEYRDLLGPVIRLRRLSDNELYALVTRVTKLHGMHFGWTPRVNDTEMVTFLKECTARAGADVMITPREIIRDYMSVLNILYQNPEADFASVVGKTVTLATEDAEGDDDFSLA
ncbi:MAG: ATP-binding protein, partial [Clostridia bacterium]|nr:ATP-binding protein [Clostridia bacterium]